MDRTTKIKVTFWEIAPGGEGIARISDLAGDSDISGH
jgi:hypothetical protein